MHVSKTCFGLGLTSFLTFLLSVRCSHGDEDYVDSGEDDATSSTKSQEVANPENLCHFERVKVPPVDAILQSTCGLAKLGSALGLKELYYSSPDRFHSDPLKTKTGAIRINQQFEDGLSSFWYPEYQQHGADFIQAGLTLINETMVQRGLFVLDWAVKRLKGVYSFEKEGDDVRHSITFLFEACARAAVLLRSNGQCDEYVDSSLIPLLRRLSSWASEPEGDSMSGQGKFTHIRLIRAASYFYMKQLLPLDDELYVPVSQAAKAYLDYALAAQWADGTFPEKKGFDVHYQGFSTMFISRVYATLDSAKDRKHAKKAQARGIYRLYEYIQQDGTVSLNGSVRVTVEHSRDGNKKTVDYKSIIIGLFYSSMIHEDRRYYETGRHMAHRYYHLKTPERYLPNYKESIRPWKACSSPLDALLALLKRAFSKHLQP